MYLPDTAETTVNKSDMVAFKSIHGRQVKEKLKEIKSTWFVVETTEGPVW